ncbi:MAG: arginyltransferase [Hyphomicrobiales bacterium]|nr:arginyltransferase [Hyphomicrobiales bacterium]
MTKHALDAPQFYLTAPASCPYLDGKLERKVFTHLVGEKASAINDMLTQGGFRRSQNIAYRPACDNCKACVSVRVIVDQFSPSKSLKRILSANKDLMGSEMPPSPNPEQFSLFCDYLASRHKDGGMAGMTSLDFAMMVEDSHVNTSVIEYRKRGIDSGITGKGSGPLIGVALSDVLADGLSMVYSFFDVDEKHNSLGSYMILDHIFRARKLGLPYLYLGFWIEQSPKMSYKTRFKPQQHLIADSWQDIE